MNERGLAAACRRHSDKLRFALVGGSAFVLGALSLGALGRLGVPQIVAQGPTLAVCVTFTWFFNRRWTFGTVTGPSWREYLRYVLMSASGLAVNSACFTGLSLVGVGSLPAFAASTLVAMAFNYTGYKFAVFRPR